MLHQAGKHLSGNFVGRRQLSMASDEQAVTAEHLPVQKRKGGRKPVVFMNNVSIEERKQRNREAQATFREHRMKYITQLENDIKRKDQKLSELQKAVEDSLMLKYKYSLLERILLEKGKSPSQSILHQGCRHRR